MLGYDLANICFNGPAELLDSTIHSQPALFVVSLAAVESLRANSPGVVENCQAAAGLSLGEYSALVFAGAMDFETGLKVVQERGAAMQAAADRTPSGMVSILGLDRPAVEALFAQAAQGELLQVANLLTPGNIAVSGTKAACERVAEWRSPPARCGPFLWPWPGAFHTSIMQSAVERLKAALAGATLVKPRIPVFSNVDAKTHEDPDEIRDLLVQQVVSPVLWEDSQRALLALGCDEFYEVGPGRVLRVAEKNRSQDRLSRNARLNRVGYEQENPILTNRCRGSPSIWLGKPPWSPEPRAASVGRSPRLSAAVAHGWRVSPAMWKSCKRPSPRSWRPAELPKRFRAT